MAGLGAILVFLMLYGGTILLRGFFSGGDRAGLRTSALELFDTTNVLDIHLRFEAEQWAAMEPEGGAGPFGGPGGPGGPGRFGPAMILAPMFVGQGDADKDSRLSRKEFLDLSEKLFLTWDTDGGGTLDAGQVRTGLNGSPLPAAGFAMPRAG